MSMLKFHRCSTHPRSGFTMIELMVVIGIIVLAAGMMTPSITEYFKQRQLDQSVSLIRGAISAARLRAVNERSEVQLVFFREGIRVFSARENKFVDENFAVKGTPIADGSIWYVLGFLNERPNLRLQSYAEWEEKNVPVIDDDSSKSSRRSRRARRRRQQQEEKQLNLRDIPTLTFLRDGSVRFDVGSDVSSIALQEDPPKGADIIVYNVGNPTGCFIDIQRTGQNRSRTVSLAEEPRRPSLEAEDSKKKKKRRRRKRS